MPTPHFSQYRIKGSDTFHDLDITKGSVPAKSKGSVTLGKQVTDLLLIKPYLSQQALKATGSVRSLLIDKEFIGRD